MVYGLIKSYSSPIAPYDLYFISSSSPSYQQANNTALHLSSNGSIISILPGRESTDSPISLTLDEKGNIIVIF